MYEDKTATTTTKICVRRDYSLDDLLMELDGEAFDTLNAIIEAGAGDLFASEIMETYDGDISYGELLGILNGPEAFEICGLNPDGSKNDEAWGRMPENGAADEKGLDEVDEELELIKNSTGEYDRMPDGLPTVVYTIDEEDPDWEEKLNELENAVYDLSNKIESYDIYLEGGFNSPRGGEETEIAVDPIYDADEDPLRHEEDKKAVLEFLNALLSKPGFRKIDFDSVEIENAVLPAGDINPYGGDIGALRDELAHTHDFEEPHEIKDYLEDAGFNVVDTGNGFEAWYKDPSNRSASYIKFTTSQCWDDMYGPCCRLDESTFRVVHPKKTMRR